MIQTHASTPAGETSLEAKKFGTHIGAVLNEALG